MIDNNRYNFTMTSVEIELADARSKFPPMRNLHEGYAVLLEEVDELWEEIKVKPYPGRAERIRKEAIQVAAMAIRFLEDLC